jgi:hypothetical protein
MLVRVRSRWLDIAASAVKRPQNRMRLQIRMQLLKSRRGILPIALQ